MGYAQLATPVMALWIFGSALELPLVHFLVPWHAVRISLLVFGVWGLLWMVGVLAGLRSYPHLLGSDTLRIRNGALHDIAVPWQAIAQVTTQHRSQFPVSQYDPCMLAVLWINQAESKLGRDAKGGRPGGPPDGRPR